MFKYFIILLFILFNCIEEPVAPVPEFFTMELLGDSIISINDTLVVTASCQIPEIIHYLWRIDKGPVIDSTDTNIIKICWHMQDTGVHTIRASAFSGQFKMTNFVNKEIRVMYSVPAVKIRPCSTVTVFDTVVIHADASDNDGYIKAYSWSVDSAGVFWSAYGSDSLVWKWNTMQCGRQMVRVKVTDDDGLSAFDSLSILVVPQPPGVFFQAKKDTAVFAHDTLTLVAYGHDPNGSIARYIWIVDGEEVDARSDSLELCWVAKDTGLHKIIVSVVDDDSIGSNTDTFFVTVLPGHPEVAMRQNMYSYSVFDTVKLVCDAFDTNGKIEKYYWYSDGNTLIDSTDTPGVSFVYTGKTPLRVVCKIRDNDGLVDSDSAIIRFNRPPEMKIKPPDDTLWVGEGDFPASVSFYIHCIDPDSDTVKYNFFMGNNIQSLQMISQGKDTILVGTIQSTGTMYWKIEAVDLWGHHISQQGSFCTFLTHTICFAGHSIVEGMNGDGQHGGFRKGVIDGLRDSLQIFERLKCVGPIVDIRVPYRVPPSWFSLNNGDDSCLALSGTLAREIYLMLDRGYQQLKADIWVLMVGANGNFTWYGTKSELAYTVKIIDIMYARNPNSRIYVLNSPPFDNNTGNYTRPDNYNEGLKDSIHVRDSSGYNIHLLDMYSLLTKDDLLDSTFFDDGLHPNQVGYDLMAKKILEVMFNDTSKAIIRSNND